MARVLSRDKLFGVMEYQPHNVQQQYHDSTARFKLVDAGRRTGKSNMGGHELTTEALRAKFRKGLSKHGKRAEFWIVGPEYSDGEKEFRVLYNDLQKMGVPFDKPGTYYSVGAGEMDISLWDGKFQVHVKSAKYPNSLVGEALEGVILAEAAKLKPVIWTKFIRPMLADYRGWARFTSTPEGKNWFYNLYKRGQDPNDTEWWSIKAPSWSNNILFPLGRQDPEILDMEKDMSAEKFKQEIGAEFTEFVGRVYKQYDEDVNLVECLYDPRKPLYVCADYGYTNPTVVLFVQVGVWGDVYVIGEYYRAGRRIDEVARDLQNDSRLNSLMNAATILYGDPEDPAATDYLAEKFKLKKGGNTGGSLSARIDLIRRWLEPQPLELEDGHPDKLPKLWVDRSCEMLNKEMQDYRYPETKEEANKAEPENPLKVDDHAPEALSRFFGGHFHEQKPKKRARVSTARMAA
jgi:hypothetical protein